MNPAPNLFLVGPMGAGKTTVGRKLAERLRMPFHDLDHEIENHTGAAITLIFELDGEDGFRRREGTMLAELAAHDGNVVATGGGAVLDADNRRVLRERGFVVWLDASVPAQLARLSRDRQRPLLAAPDRHARLAQLAAARNPLYAEIADVRMSSSGAGSSERVAKELFDLLEGRWQRGSAGAPA